MAGSDAQSSLGMSAPEPQKLIEMAVGLRKRALSAVQAERRRLVDERNRRIQLHASPPESGIFGKGKRDEKP
jgi:hypothetical protein